MKLTENEFMRKIYIFIATISFLGIMGSVAVFLVYSRKAFAKSSYRIYFKGLAIFDTFLVFYLGFSLASLLLNIDVINEVNFVCKLFYFVTVGTSQNSGWVLVFYSIDQLIRVSMTKRFEFIKKRQFQLRVMCGMAVFHFLSAIYVVKQVEVKEVDLGNNSTGNRCEYPLSQIALPVFFFLDSSLIPFAIMIVSTILVLKYLYVSRNTIQRYDSIDRITVIRRLSANKGRQMRFAFKSVVFNIVFIVLTTPSVFAHLYRGDHFYDVYFNRLKTISFVFFCLNFSIHFWIHLFSNSIFRSEILQIITC